MGPTISLHRGGKDGPVLATADPSHEVHGSSKIHCTDPESTIVLEHVPGHGMGLVFPPKTHFSIGDKKYYWKRYNDVFEEKTDRLVAQFTAEGMDANSGNLLTMEGNDETTREILVLSTVLMQGRSEARKRAVDPCSSVWLII
jgi:hypothetical protein